MTHIKVANENPHRLELASPALSADHRSVDDLQRSAAGESNSAKTDGRVSGSPRWACGCCTRQCSAQGRLLARLRAAPDDHILHETDDGEKMSSQSGTCEGYSVEARSAFTSAEVINGQLFDERWSMVRFNDNSPIGVPRGPVWSERWLAACGLYDYAAAQSLRWWFHAQSAHKLCLETRLVKHTITYSVDSKRISEHVLITGEDRSSMMPDWNKKP